MTVVLGAGPIVAHAEALHFTPRKRDTMAMPIALRRFTVDEYHRMAEAGVLTQDDRVELLDGEILVMSPIGSRHAATVARIQDLLARALGGRAIVWVQNPIRQRPFSEPQPDVCLLRPRADFYSARHPEAPDILLLVEVADTSLGYDRERKIPLYARSGMAETWLVNLPEDAIDVHRQPQAGAYADLRTARRGETVSPLAFPGLALSVDDILGPAP
jgi:Uma2 family endonuclease